MHLTKKQMKGQENKYFPNFELKKLTVDNLELY